MTELSEHTARTESPLPTVGVLGGTGDLGRGLATRWARAGVPVLLGSRDGGRAAQTASSISASVAVAGTTNKDCAARAEIVLVAVPWDSHETVLQECAAELAGRIVVDVVNPLGFDKQGAFALRVEDGSACQQAQRLLPDSRVVGAFHHVSAVLLLDDSVRSLDLDVLVVGDDREATDTVQRIAELMPGVRAVFAGRLRNAGQVEAMTANLISVNRRYKTHAGLRLTMP